MLVTLHVENVYTKMTVEGGRKASVVALLKQYLRYEKPFTGYGGRQRPSWDDGYRYLVSDGGRSYTGLLDLIVAIFDHHGVAYQLDDRQTPVKLPNEDLILRRLNRIPLTPRPYQEEAIFAGLTYRRGMFNLCTGAGKTLVMSALCSLWGQQTLVVCDSADLAHQLRDEIAELVQEPVGLTGAGELDIQDITVGMVSTLVNKNSGKKKRQKIQDYLNGVVHLIFDEVHHSQAKTWRDVSIKCRNASLRHGFSGTCFSSEEVLEDGSRKHTRDLLLLAHTGQIICSVKTKELVDLGYLSKPTVFMIKNEVYSDGAPLDPADEYTRIISEDVNRNNLIAKIIKKEYDRDEQSIVFVDRIEHGDNIVALCQEHGIPGDEIEFVQGSDHRKYREETLRDFKQKRLPVLVGTVLGEGLNFFAKAGVNAAAGRSKKNVIQRLGRVLRKEVDPELGDVDTSTVRSVAYYDFLDKGHPWYSRQAEERYRIYKEEGHDVRVIRIFDGEVLESGIESLPIRGQNLRDMYSTFVDIYKDKVGRWKWQKGEKGRVKQTFVYLTEALNIRKAAEFEMALDLWDEYLRERFIEWLNWDKASRDNLIGFVANKRSMELFAAKERNQGESDLDIAGTERNEDWDF